MKRKLLLLFVCLFGALGGVKAWTPVNPENNRAYYLYNVGKGTYWYGADHNIGSGNTRYTGHTSSLYDATPTRVRISSGNYTFTYYVNGVEYQIRHTDDNGEAVLTGGNANFQLYDKTDGYSIEFKSDKQRRMRAENAGTCDYPKDLDNNTVYWRFYAYEEILPDLVAHNASTCASTAATIVSGWERVTTKGQLAQNPERYFYAIFSAVNPGVMMTTEYNDSKYRMCYKAAGNPLSSSSYDLFEMENYDGEFAIKSNITGKYYGNTSGAPWDFQANQETLNEGCKVTVTCSNGVYNLQDKYADAYAATDPFVGNYLGAWDNMEFVGERLAGNKSFKRAGYFLIYRKLKKDLDMTSRITNPSFEAEDISAWSCTTGNDTGRKNNSGNYAMSNGAGSFLFNTWNNGGASEVSQTLSNMPSGFYTLSAVMASDNNETLRLKVGNDVIATSTATGAGNGIETSGSFSFSGGNMVIKADANNHWYKADNFRLTYLGGMEDLTPVSGLMNTDVNTAQQNAVSAYNSNKTAANYIAATEAIAAAEVSKAAYAQINSSDLTAYRTKIGNVLTKTNVYTTEAYNKWYANVQDNYNNGVYTNEEVVTLTGNGAYNSEWRSSNRVDDILMSTWDEVPMNWDSYHINTWSGEGSEDGSGFLVPFFEYWVAGENVLGAKTMTSTVTGLEANTEYSVNIWARVRQTDNQSKVAGSITMQVGSGLTVDLTTGSPVGSTQFYLNHFTATGSTNGEGQLTITINVAANSNISWLSFKDVAISKQATTGDVQTYSGLINNDTELVPTTTAPIVDITEATFTGDITASFSSNANGFIIATAEQKAALDDVKNVVVDNTCDNLVLTDGTDFVAPGEFTATSANYSRAGIKLSKDRYATVYLPYAFSTDGLKVMEYTSYEDGVLTFTPVDVTVPSTPYLVRIADDGEEDVIEDYDFSGSGVVSATDASGDVFKGTYNAQTLYATVGGYNYYGFSAKYGDFRQASVGGNTCAAFRAYLKLSDGTNARVAVRFDDDKTTGIVTLDADGNINGAEVMKDGKYIIDNKVVIVKNGVKYGANGQKLN